MCARREEREGDLAAQIGACRVGEQRILEMVAKYGEDRLRVLTDELLNYSERLVRAELRRMPAGEYTAEDWLDDDGVDDKPIKMRVQIRTRSSMRSRCTWTSRDRHRR